MLNDKANPASEITDLRSRIVTLESDNAALTRERDAVFNEGLQSIRQLAAAQATNAKLRDACLELPPIVRGRALNEAIALPNDTAALDARLKEERERMIALYSPDDTAQDWMDKIRGMT